MQSLDVAPLKAVARRFKPQVPAVHMVCSGGSKAQGTIRRHKRDMTVRSRAARRSIVSSVREPTDLVFGEHA